MTQDDAKRSAAEYALRFVQRGEILGVGTGSTVNFFIDALESLKKDIPGAVSSSEASSNRLQKVGIPVLDLNQVPSISIYVDGTDETNPRLQLIKGGGGALTREKIVAAVSRRFICIADESKLVPVLGGFPLPLEVIPMARAYVARRMLALGGQPRLREDFLTDNGNLVLDVAGLSINDPAAMETEINGIAGVVCVGLFAHRGADVLVLGSRQGVREISARA